MNPPSSSIVDAPDKTKSKGAVPAEDSKKELSPLEVLRQAAKNSEGKKPTDAKPSPKRSAFSREAMQWTRRLHLYTGLFLLPWVFLYGVTGVLFNHPTWFSDTFQMSFSQDAVEGTSLGQMIPAVDIANLVVAELNETSDSKYTLLDPEKISYGRTGLNAAFVGADQKDYQVFLNETADGGTIREPRRRKGGGGGGNGGGGNSKEAKGEHQPNSERNQGDSKNEKSDADKPRGNKGELKTGEQRSPSRRGSRANVAPFAIDSGLEVADSPIMLFEEALPTILARSGFEGASISAVSLEPISFKIKDDKKTWNVQYDVATGSVSGTEDKPEEGEAQLSSMSFRRYLLQLHKARGYPGEEVNVRSIWAVFVDAMSFTMCFWGISGVVMWWQIKRTRPIGTALLGISVALAGIIGYVMWVEMIS